jgi:hypothetical protein
VKRSEIRERLMVLFDILPSLHPRDDLEKIHALLREVMDLIDDLDNAD